MACGQDIAHAAPEQAPAAAEVATLLRRLIRASDLQSRRIERTTGLTSPQAAVLRAVETLGHGATRALADEVSLSQATVTVVLDRLSAKGLVERYADRADRRVRHARLTRAGRRLLAALPPLPDAAFHARYDALPAERRSAMITALRELTELLGPGAESAGEPRPIND